MKHALCLLEGSCENGHHEDAGLKRKFTRTQTLTTDKKTKNETLKKAKTNSNELASGTARQAKTEGGEKKKEDRSG